MLTNGIEIFVKKKKRYKNLSEDEKQKLPEYRRNYYVTLKIIAGLFNEILDFFNDTPDKNTLNFTQQTIHNKEIF